MLFLSISLFELLDFGFVFSYPLLLGDGFYLQWQRPALELVDLMAVASAEIG
jgi:hypothetical protein